MNLSQKTRVAIDKNNVSVKRIESKCIRCGQCAKICNAFASVNNNYDLKKTGKSICVNCGQCIKVCPTGSLVCANEYKQLKLLMKDKSKIFIISTSPSVRVGLGDEFGYQPGSFVEGKMVALLRKLGFKYVLDTNFSADLTICEEAAELIERLNKKQNLPQFTSCCPAWIKFVETFYPELLPNISSCKSPLGMQATLVKTYFAKKMNLNPDDIVSVALTPCVAKKFELKREELKGIDYCITTTELASWAKEKGIIFNDLKDSKFDEFMGNASGAGVIFGNTGGVMEAAIRTAYSYLTGKEPSQLDLEEVRGLRGIREAEIDLNGTKIKIAVVFGLGNARRLIQKIKKGEKYDFVEVMACPGGCIGGGGQPKHLTNEAAVQKKRIEALYTRDKNLKCRVANKNPEIVALYSELLGKPNSKIAMKMLHTKYFDRSDDLKGENL